VTLPDPPSSCRIYTAPELANAIVGSLGDQPQLSWLEPSHGKGAFLNAMANLGVARERIVAVDLDRTTSEADILATTLRGVDFLRWAAETEQRFDRIVGNPPYVSIERLPAMLQHTAESILDLNEEPIGRGANVWYAFVLSSIRLLKSGGSFGFVLPSAAEFADYSAEMRILLRRSFCSVEIFRCRRPLFSEVKEGSIVAIARGYGSNQRLFRRTAYATPADLIRSIGYSGGLEPPGREGEASERSSEAARGHSPRCSLTSERGRSTRSERRVRDLSKATSSSLVELGHIATIRIGGVTGDASYFLMNEQKRRLLNLPASALTPVVSRARHLRYALMAKKEWSQLKEAGERVWLFKPGSAAEKNLYVRRYLELSASEGGCNRAALKVANRSPWFHTPLPESPDAFLSGMAQHTPWLCINELQGLNATNTLYVLRFRETRRVDRYMWALAMLSSVAHSQLRSIGRQYADGLVKYEPGSLCKIMLPRIEVGEDHKLLYMRAVEALLSGDSSTARKIADSVLA
jgi:adenine-specific DNA-methyltransferase